MTMKKWMIWSLVGLVVVMICAGIVIRFVNADGIAPKGSAQIAVTATKGNPPTIADMQKQLLDPKLDPQSRQSLMDKIEVAQREEQNQSAGAANPAPKDQPGVAALNSAPVLLQVESKISDGSQGMVKPSLADIVNNWHGMLSERIVTALAGSKPDDITQGLLVVFSISADPQVNDAQIDVYPAKTGSGPLKVISEENGVITLTGSNGYTVKFDLNTRVYVP
jgi:hypothetical protein